jgi:hypothetical protein
VTLWPSYYNGIPRYDELPAGFWERRADTPGVELDHERALAFLGELGDGLRELRPEATPASGRYHAPNGSFDVVDAAVTWATVRRFRPRRVLELGSGFSTLVIRDALRANGDGAHHVVVDPFPRPGELGDTGAFDLRTISASDLPASEYAALGAGDLLFIDTTHTVKVGSEVNEIVLRGLPRLAAGVLVHIHDVFLPYEYPRRLVEGQGYHWAEQYLVQAFLAFNEQFEVLAPMHMLMREHRDELAALMAAPDVESSSLWLRRSR